MENAKPVRALMLTNKKNIHVEWGDCDPAGIVYYPRYFAYFDNCTAALFEAAGLPKHEMLKTYGIVGIPMVDTRARFIAPSRFGEDVIVESSISEWGRSSFAVQHRLFKGDDLAVECFETRVWAVRSGSNAEKIEGQDIPQEVRDKFAAASKPR
jgi:4-hydroxybenzoyl-CoA thioesterase